MSSSVIYLIELYEQGLVASATVHFFPSNYFAYIVIGEDVKSDVLLNNMSSCYFVKNTRSFEIII